MNENRPLPPPWAIAGGVAAALALIFLLGVGYGQRWGAEQWGPLAAWVAGAATFGAVFVALREAARSQRAREIDHEIGRRRECITALGDLWGGLLGMGGPVETFVIYLDGLDPEFNPKEQRSPAPLRGPVETYGEQIAGRIHEFWGLLTSTVEPLLFTARLVLRGTPLYGPVGQLYEEIKNFKAELIGAIKLVLLEGRRPDTDPILAMWHDLEGRRGEHSGLAVQHFSLDRRDVERYLRRSRRR